MRALKVSIIFWTLSCVPALAWGVEGHRIVARIAATELTPSARAAVADLLGRDDALEAMVAASTWADEIRPRRRETAPWHYVDIEIDRGGYNASRDCPDDACVVAQVQRDAKIVGDVAVAKPIRAEALRFFIHFVGDLHQPLHCADNHDRGGNSVKVVIAGEYSNLHAVWDTAVVEGLGPDDVAVSSTLARNITVAERVAWTSGSVVDWANETFGIAKSAIYKGMTGPRASDAPLILPANYVSAERTVVETQLERAGVRLAWLLNRSFK